MNADSRQKTSNEWNTPQYNIVRRQWGEKYFQFWQNAICESYLGLYLSEEDIFEKFALFRCTFCSPWGPPLDIALHPILLTLTSQLYLEYFPMQNILQPAIQDWLVQAALGISLKSLQAKEGTRPLFFLTQSLHMLRRGQEKTNRT